MSNNEQPRHETFSFKPTKTNKLPAVSLPKREEKDKTQEEKKEERGEQK